ncbi:MAG: hypothetical protein HYZ11_05685 [Candidatus Tectomicrobia bacterium]|uniref:Uncharacterized protein n=1 Tax=Tectimicrobiota bacterium TaxID=2528274 RepID=A0A932MLD9_UNCTE|nr:hypothetical protein [Candidatus Tectomicrobia bacterium]
MHPIAVQRAVEFLGQFTKTARPDISRLVVEIQDEKPNPAFTIFYRNGKSLSGSLPLQRPLSDSPEESGEGG